MIKSVIPSHICAFIFGIAGGITLINSVKEQPKQIVAPQNIVAEVSIDGTPEWRKVEFNDVLHIVIDDNKLTTVKSYSNTIQ